MPKILTYIVALAAILAIAEGIERYRAYDRKKAAEAFAEARFQQTPPKTKGPDLPLILLAGKAELAEEALAQLKGNSLRFERAGALFFASYVPIAELLPALCAENKVDVRPFAQSFEALHAEALARARKLTTDTPLAEKRLREEYGAGWLASLVDGLNAAARANDRSVADECRELAFDGAGTAARSNLGGLIPAVYTVLYEQAAAR